MIPSRVPTPDSFSPRDFARAVVEETLEALGGYRPMEKEFLTRKEAAVFLSVHPAHLSKLARTGGPRFYGSGKMLRYARTDLIQWIREQDGGAS